MHAEVVMILLKGSFEGGGDLSGPDNPRTLGCLSIEQPAMSRTDMAGILG